MSFSLVDAWRQQKRANEKVRRARQMMPFIRKIARAAAEIHLNFDREELLMDLESIKDCLMDEVEHDPELSHDDKILMANLVSGIAKNWTRIQGYVYDSQSEKPFAFGFVTVAFIDILFRRYTVHIGGTPEDVPELEVLLDALGIEPPKDGP